MSNTSDFTIVDGVLKAYNGRGGDVVVPDGVVEIYVLAFANNNDITSVTLPGTVERILFSAFSSCEKLTHVSIPKSTSYIDRQAFFGSKRLADQDGFVVMRAFAKNSFF